VDALTGPSGDGLPFFTGLLKHLTSAGASAATERSREGAIGPSRSGQGGAERSEVPA